VRPEEKIKFINRLEGKDLNNKILVSRCCGTHWLLKINKIEILPLFELYRVGIIMELPVFETVFEKYICFNIFVNFIVQYQDIDAFFYLGKEKSCQHFY